jgi:hypothetical protein
MRCRRVIVLPDLEDNVDLDWLMAARAGTSRAGRGSDGAEGKRCQRAHLGCPGRPRGDVLVDGRECQKERDCLRGYLIMQQKGPLQLLSSPSRLVACSTIPSDVLFPVAFAAFSSAMQSLLLVVLRLQACRSAPCHAESDPCPSGLPSEKHLCPILHAAN